MSSSSSIEFHEVYPGFHLDGKENIGRWLTDLAEKEGKSLSTINYIFLTDDELLGLNQSQLGHDYYTDIITFPLNNEDDPIEADIYISIDRVKENAKDYKVSFETELLRVIAHGLLHLCGYNDKTIRQQTHMRKKEEEYLDLYAKSI